MKEETPQENWITRVNYNPRIKGLAGTAVFGTTALIFREIERTAMGDAIPPHFRGHVSDAFSSPAYASLSQLLYNEDDREVLSAIGFAGGAGVEIFQKLGIFHGTYDPRDFVAYAAGTALWVTFDTAAKILHDTGATLPIYRALGIRHRRFS